MPLDRRKLQQGLKQSDKDKASQAFVGQTFNRYEILALLGRGGAGAVFRARHKELGSLVALKLLLADEPSKDQVARFQREGRVLAQLKHDNVVGITDLGTHDGIPFLAMELVEGDDLHHLVRGPGGAPLEFDDAVHVALEIARALHHVHESGAYHRDVKPNNILIEHGSRRPVLTDFGLVKPDPSTLGQDGKAVTMAGALIGTPSYMAPEQFDPDGEFGSVGPKTDVWGLGATLFFLLTGQPPFKAKNVVDLYAAVTNDGVPTPQSVRSTIPDAINDVTMACLTKRVDERIDTSELIERLENLEGGLEQEGSRRGVRHALVVLLFFLGLIGVHFALNPDKLQALLQGDLAGAGAGASAAEDPGAGSGGESGDGTAGTDELAGLSPAELVKRGRALYAGDEVERDLEAALRCFQAAYAQQDAVAALYLGILHASGTGTTKDPAAAKRYYEEAAERGDEQVRSQAQQKLEALLSEHPELGS